MSRHKNTTKQDATARVMLSRVGSCVYATDTYLDQLELELHKWLDDIKEHRYRQWRSRS